MGQPATADLIAEFLLRYYREPMRYRAQAPRATHLYGNLDSVVRLALGRTVKSSDAALRGPATVTELERAAVFYIQQQFFRDDATHYEVLGLANDASAKAVRENFRLLMQLIHPDRQGADTIWPESYAARANRAHAVLKSSRSRTDYDRQLTTAHGREASPNPATIVAGMRGPARVVPSPRRPAPVSALPEWVTAGVGGFVREHPRFTAFAVLVGASVLAIFLVVDNEREGVLAVESGGYSTPLSSKVQPLERASRSARGSPADGASTIDMSTGVREPPVVADGVAGARAVEAQTPQSVPVPMTPQPVRMTEPAPAEVAAQPVVRAVAPSITVPPVRSAPPGASGSVVAMAALAPASPQAPASAPVQPPPATTLSAVVPSAPPATTLVPVALPAVPPPVERRAATVGPPLESAEVEVLIASFVSSYEKGRLDTFAKLFDDDAQANQQRGRAAIASEYDQLFRSTVWRHIAIFQLGWKPVGDHTEAKGEFLVKTGWRDGREVEQRVAVDMDLVRQGGRAVIAKLSFQPR